MCCSPLTKKDESGIITLVLIQKLFSNAAKCGKERLEHIMKRYIAAFLCIIMTVSLIPFSAGVSAAFDGEDKINIVLDPGHGGANVGTSARGTGEKTFTYSIATILKAKLEANGNFNVYLTRTGDYDLELYERAVVADSYNADILISLHFDGNGDSRVCGVTTYTSVLDAFAATTLSSSIASNISSATGLYNNGVRRRSDTAGYYWSFEKQWDCKDPSLGTLSDYYGIPTWCAKFGIPSIIVEHGYFSNNGDVSIIFAEGGLEKIAEAEAQAIISYYTNHTHVYSSAIRDFASNCVFTGKQSEHCSVCGHRRNVTSLAPDPDNHYWITKESTPASCGVDGRVVRECRITENLIAKNWQGATHDDVQVIPAPSDHSFVVSEEVAATHTADGYQRFQCSTCSYSFTEVIKAEGHTYEFTSYTAPTCTEVGGSTYTCTVCSESFLEPEEALGHRMELITDTPPTCLEGGILEEKCTVCEYVFCEEYEPLGHDIIDGERVEPTCTEDGYQSGICTRCSIEATEVLEKTGHSLAVTEDIPATCTEDGKTVSGCTACEYTETEVHAAEGHSLEKKVLLAATCVGEGKESVFCNKCSYNEKTVVPAIGHVKSEKGTVTLKATVFKEGEIQYVCKNGCGKTYVEVIPASAPQSLKVVTVASLAAIIAAVIGIAVIIIIKKTAPKEAATEAAAPSEAETAEALEKESEESAEVSSEKQSV